jgi:hypothetical protein
MFVDFVLCYPVEALRWTVISVQGVLLSVKGEFRVLTAASMKVAVVGIVAPFQKYFLGVIIGLISRQGVTVQKTAVFKC